MTTNYREDKNSVFHHKHHSYSLNKIFQVIDQQVAVPLSVESIDLGVMGIDKQQMIDGRYVCQSCLGDPKRHLERLNSVDLAAPIVILREEQILYIVDGMHRVEKALRDKVQTLSAKSISASELRDYNTQYVG